MRATWRPAVASSTPQFAGSSKARRIDIVRFCSATPARSTSTPPNFLAPGGISNGSYCFLLMAHR